MVRSSETSKSIHSPSSPISLRTSTVPMTCLAKTGLLPPLRDSLHRVARRPPIFVQPHPHAQLPVVEQMLQVQHPVASVAGQVAVPAVPDPPAIGRDVGGDDRHPEEA